MTEVPFEPSYRDPFDRKGLEEFAGETKEAREQSREALLGEDPSLGKKIGVGATEIGVEVLGDPLTYVGAGVAGGAAKSLPWLRRLAKVKPKTAGALAGAGAASAEGVLSETMLAEGLDPKERFRRAMLGGVGGASFGGAIGAVAAKFAGDKMAAKGDDAIEAAIDDLLGPRSGFDPELEEERLLARYVPGQLEQDAAVSMSLAKATADKYGVPSEAIDHALFDPSFMRYLPDEVAEHTKYARSVLDEQSESLIRPGGKVYDQMLNRANELADQYDTTPDEVLRDVKKWVQDALKDDRYEDVVDALPEGFQRLFKLSALEESIKKNKGVYAHRVYERFMVEDFADRRFHQIDDIRHGRIPDEMDSEDAIDLVVAYDDLMAMVSEKFPDKYFVPGADGVLNSAGELKARQILSAAMEGGNPTKSSVAGSLGWDRKSKVPKSDWGELKHRKLTDSKRDRALRTLFGEDKDPTRQLLRSIVRISADQQAYDFKKMLSGRLLADTQNYSATKIPGVMGIEITSVSEAGLPPVYTRTRAMADEFDEAVGTLDGGIVDAINYASKAMATVMNPTTHGRNILANPAFLLYSGLNPLRFLNPRRWKESIQMLKLLDNDPGSKLLSLDPKVLDEMRLGSREMMRRGILTNVDTTDLDDFALDIKRKSAMNKGGGVRVADLVSGATEFVTRKTGAAKLYQNEDFFFKNMGYSLERKRLMDTKVFSEDEVRALTIASVENMLPTYSRIPKVTEKFRKLQVIAPFVNFYSELIRTAKKSGETAIQMTFKPGDYLEQTLGKVGTEAQQKAIRRIGRHRLYGMAATMAAPYAMKRGIEHITQVNMTPEENQAARDFMPPWSKNNPVAYFHKGNGEFAYIDLGFLFPHSAISRAAMGDPSGLAEPFISPQITVSEIAKAYDDLQNVSELSMEEKQRVLAYRGYRMLAPGAIKYAERVLKGVSHDTELGKKYLDKYFPGMNRYGTEYSTLREVLSPVGRPAVQNVGEGLMWRGKEFARAYRQSRDLVSAEKNSPSRRLGAIERADESYEAAAKEMLQYVNSARVMGLSDRQIKASLTGPKSAHLKVSEVEALLRGRLPEFTPPEFK